MAEPTHGRTVTNAPVPVVLPPPIGETRLRYTNDTIVELEDVLEPLMDKLNARLEKRGDEPYESVWDALEELQAAWPFRATLPLLRAGLPPEHAALAGDLPPSVIISDQEVGDALGEALAIAFGVDPSELEQSEIPTEETDTPGPPMAAAHGGAGSTGSRSTPSGPPPPPSAG